MRSSWLVSGVFALLLAACSSGGGSSAGFTTHDASLAPADAGADASVITDAGSEPAGDAGNLQDDADAGAAQDAGSATQDAGPKGPLDPILEYTTCKPEEINPIVQCVTVTCPKAPDPIALVKCELDMCAPLVNKVNPKCKDCVTAAVAQDTAGLLENCLDLEPITGGN